MLLHVDGYLVEIRPGEQFSSLNKVDSRYLEEIKAPAKAKPKPKPKPKAKEKLDVSSAQS